MKLSTGLRISLIVVIAAAVMGFAAATPKITVSATRMPTHARIQVHGSGFTPSHNVSSHLQSPDGKEYPVLPILTDANGEFDHEIDTLLLAIGTHELWVVDDSSKTSSNRIHIEITR